MLPSLHVMRPQVLGALSFELTVPTAKTFLRRFLKAACSGDPAADSRLECLSSYLTELMLPEYRALQFLPSQVHHCVKTTTLSLSVPVCHAQLNPEVGTRAGYHAARSLNFGQTLTIVL